MYRRGLPNHGNNSPTTTRHTVRFAGNAIEATVTSKASSVDDWIQSIRSAHQDNRPITVVGLDCEWRPNYVRGQSNKVATLQQCVENKCLLLQLFHLDYIPQSLRDFLADTDVSFAGAGIGGDVAKLRNDYGLRVSTTLELEQACRNYMSMGEWIPSGRKLGLKGYAREILGVVMEKPMQVTRSNWEARNLTEKQIEYATIDAYVSYRLGRHVLL